MGFRGPKIRNRDDAQEENSRRIEPIFHAPEQLEIVQLNLPRYQGH
jgi:hypothetical protein